MHIISGWFAVFQWAVRIRYAGLVVPDSCTLHSIN